MNPFGSFDVPTLIASSTTGYLATFSPIFIAIIGLVLAMALIVAIIEIFANRGNPHPASGTSVGYDDIVPDDIL